MISKCPITDKKYKIPKNNDRININAFIQKNKHNKKTVAVQGLGFVGCAMSLVIANSNKNYTVIGVDTKTQSGYWKIGSLNEGKLPIVSSDKKLLKFHEKIKLKKNFYATYDSYAYSFADIIVIDINLDVKKFNKSKNSQNNFNVNFKPFLKAFKEVINNCKDNVLIILESTVPPGTCSKILQPMINDVFKKRKLSPKNVKLAHSYERVMPGKNYINSIINYHRVYSANSNASAIEAEKFFKTIINTSKYPLTRLSNTNASEVAKVLENSYRAMNIAFIQEWTEFADNSQVDLFEVISAIKKRSTHNNIMRPGLGVGGYCLTKDPLLASWASKNLFKSKSLSQSETAVTINDKMPMYSVKVLKNIYKKDLNSKKILILGVSYLNDIGDTRFTPTALLYDELKSLGAKIFLHDPYLKFWNEKKITIENQLIFRELDIVIITISHQQFLSKKYISFINKVRPHMVLDTLGFFNNKKHLFIKDINLKCIGKGL